MAQMLARMERDGFIRQTADPADGRVSLVSLTKLAKTRLPRACKVLLQGNRDALIGFIDNEIEQLVVLLTELISDLDPLGSAEML